MAGTKTITFRKAVVWLPIAKAKNVEALTNMGLQMTCRDLLVEV